jgi:large subunit ribosomal protein L24
MKKISEVTSTRLKKGDTVAVLSGRDKGKNGKILSVDRKRNMVIVEGINIRHGFQKPKSGRGPGQKVSAPGPMHPSKLILLDADKKPTRIAIKILEDGTKQRVARKTGKAI